MPDISPDVCLPALRRHSSSRDMRLRVRTPDGAQHVIDADDDCTCGALKRVIQDATGVETRAQKWKLGFPPVDVDVDDEAALCAALGVRGGETLAVTAIALEDAAVASSDAMAAAPTTYASMANMDEDEAFARALAMSMNEGVDGISTSTSDFIRLEDMHAIRRVIASDNSCLFNAVGYCCEKSLRESTRLRKVIVDAIRADPATFDEAFLGKAPTEYADWISKPNSWGGQVELFILAKALRVEIAAYDIQTERCDVYGQDADYEDRIMVIYDGLHYDSIVLNPSSIGADVEKDVSRVPASTPALASVAALVRSQHAAKKFTDTANFSLRCLVCQKGLTGQAEAVAHAKSTGHANFGEY